MGEMKYIIIPLLCAGISQIFKCIIESLRTRRFDLERLLDGAGGMPSSHSALVASLTTTIGINVGVNSPLFAVCLVFAFVVTYDAMGVRYETGKQAEIINQLTESIKLKEQVQRLKEKVGHKPAEVLCGVILGVVMAIILNRVM